VAGVPWWHDMHPQRRASDYEEFSFILVIFLFVPLFFLLLHHFTMKYFSS
jgi:hypothetical protein